MAKKIYFLVPYPEGSAPSQRFRFEQYFDHLRNQGYELGVYPFYDYDTWQTLYKEKKYLLKAMKVTYCFLKRFGLLFKLHKADHLFIHREVAHIGPPVFEWIIAKVLRRKYTYDFDDAIWLPNYSETNSRFHWVKAYWKVNYCMKWAHTISAGNEYTYPIFHYLAGIPVGCYTHYPTISTDMLDKVVQQNHSYNNRHHSPPQYSGTSSHSTRHYWLDRLPYYHALPG